MSLIEAARSVIRSYQPQYCDHSDVGTGLCHIEIAREFLKALLPEVEAGLLDRIAAQVTFYENAEEMNPASQKVIELAHKIMNETKFILTSTDRNILFSQTGD